MSKEELVRSFLDSRDWMYKEKGDEFKIKICPFCGNAKHKLWINKDTGIYHCWSCDSKDKESGRGSFNQLRERIGEVSQPYQKKSFSKPSKRFLLNSHKKLLKSKKAKKFLKKRGISLKTAKRFKLGITKLDNEDTGKKEPFIIMPHFSKDRKSFECWKARSLPPADKTFRRHTGGKTVLWNQSVINKYDSIIVAEGEIDGYSFYEGGFKNVVAVTAGAGHFDATWFDALVGKKVFLAHDMDAQGRAGAFDIARRLGLDDCYRLAPPIEEGIKDWNDVLMKHPEKFNSIVDEAMRDAKPYSMMDIYSLRETFAELLTNNELDIPGIMTPWPEFNTISKGIMPGDMCILSSPPKQGKTTIAQDIAIYNLLEVNPSVPTLFFCLESRPPKILQRFVSSIARVETDCITKDDIALTRAKLYNKPLYFGWCSNSVSPDQIFDMITHATRRLGIKFLVFDHLQFLVRDKNKVVEQTSIVSKKFKFLAEELGLALLLLAHPRKVDLNKPMNMYDLRDSSSIPGDADRIWILHRRKIPVPGTDDEPEQFIWDPKARLIVEASRWSGTGSVMLYFNDRYLRFIPLKKWEETQLKKMSGKTKKKKKGLH